MEEKRIALNAFVNLHGHKASLNRNARQVYITKFRDAGIPLNIELDTITREDITKEFNLEDYTTRWVITQLNTYDPDREVVMGLEFENNTLLTHVIRLAAEED